MAEEIKRNTPFEHPEQEAYLNLVRTASQLSGQFRALFRGKGITEAQFNVLRILRGAPGGELTCDAIGERLVTRSPDVTQLIDRLQKKSLVERHRSQEDRRVVEVVITPQGKELLQQLDPHVEELHTQQLGHMKSEDLTRLNELLVEARGCGN